MIAVRNLGVSFLGREVLREVTFGVACGTSTAIVGANGIGKTTLLRLMAGILRPTDGEVLLMGKPISEFSRQEVARQIALVPQNLEVPFPFTVREIVEQGRAPWLPTLRGLTVSDRMSVERAMERVNVEHLGARIFNQLSGGERQRVKIALGLAQQAAVMLLDEPTQNLDIGRQVELMELLATLRGDGMTIIASIHDLHLVPGNFGRVVLLGPGMKMAEGTVEEIMTRENLGWGFGIDVGEGWSPGQAVTSGKRVR